MRDNLSVSFATICFLYTSSTLIYCFFAWSNIIEQTSLHFSISMVMLIIIIWSEEYSFKSFAIRNIQSIRNIQISFSFHISFLESLMNSIV